MAYHYDHPLPSARHIDFPSVSGFAMAALGAGALVIEVNVRGWLGFAGSGVDLAVVTVWLTAAGLLSAWAFQRGDGWWQAASCRRRPPVSCSDGGAGRLGYLLAARQLPETS